MASVLIVSTSYDTSSYFTKNWAERLHDELLRRGHIGLLMSPELDCRAGNALGEALDRVDYVVFFGHGDSTGWIAIPYLSGTAQISVLDSSTAQRLSGKRVYSVCCDSLRNFGTAVASYPGSEFVGYSSKFYFDNDNHTHFRDVIVNSVIDYVSGANATSVAHDLARDWRSLSQDFLVGGLRNNLNASMAAHFADMNMKCVGSK